MYQRVANQTESLKGLWAAKLNLKGRAGMATPEDMAGYELRLGALEEELQRRKQLGGRFESTLGRLKDLMLTDEKHREEHQVCSILLLSCQTICYFIKEGVLKTECCYGSKIAMHLLNMVKRNVFSDYFSYLI